MLQWLHITLAVLSIGALSVLLIVLLQRWCCHREPQPAAGVTAASPTRSESFQARIAKLHQTSLIHQLDTSDLKRRGNINNYYVFRRGRVGGIDGGFTTKPGLFSWTDHPSLVTDAVENGWSRFGFTGHEPPPSSGGSTRSALLGLCAAASGNSRQEEEADTEITWEVFNGSADFMQKIRFNCGSRKVSNNTNNTINGINFHTAASVIRAALPLPGPHLGNSAFPQEAYFEITVLEILRRRRGGDGSRGVDAASAEGENTKLIKENSDSLVRCNKVNKKNEESKVVSSKDCDGKSDDILLCVGLTTGVGVSVPLKLPGSFPGSIGFNSNGSIYLDGLKLVFESEKHDWGKPSKVIGCGFDPRKKKVFFTVDSHLVHVINCKADEFGTPLYPTMASNIEATVVVNLGQRPFSYGPANGQRTANPCFIGPLVRSPAATVGFEDSKELFSMGRIDSQYLNRFISRGNGEENDGGSNNSGSSRRKFEDYEESDTDLFEIVLEGSGKSPGAARQ